jgi:ADP-heptose:LPS heptosyltransferase
MLRRNVLIFQTGGLGDFVLTWPLAVALGRIYPQSRIIYVTHQQKGDLARRVLRLEATDIEIGWHGLFTDTAALPAQQQALLASAKAICAFLPVNPVWRANVERLSPGLRLIEIDSKLPVDFEGHLTDRILQSLQNFPPEREAMLQLLRSIQDRGIGYRLAGGNDIVIHPGSGAREKCWPIERFMALANALKQHGKSVRFVTGEVERDRWSANDLQQLQAIAPHRSCASYVELLDELSKAGCFVGNDSGPAHLAGIIGVPTVALFGPTDPKNWKPLGPKVKTLRGNDLQVEDVLRSLSDSR